MKSKRNIIIVAIVIGIVFLSGIMIFSFNNKAESSKQVDNEEENKEIEQGNLEFLNAIAGVRADNIEIINSPVVGVKGKIFVPEEPMVNGINYFLKKTNNDKMKEIEIDIENNSISIYVNYAVTEKFKTPIKVNIVPSLNENKDLVIDIGEVKFIDLKIADFLVNLALKTFIKDWFDGDNDIKVDYNEGNVVIYRENFKDVNLKSISIENEELILDVVIDGKAIS